MKNDEKTLPPEELAAQNEPPVSAEDILAEIEPLLKDYFIGEFSTDGDSITYALPNGQKFCLTAKETA